MEARYGDEFAELLLAEMSERPRSWRRSTDVVLRGLSARLADAGLTTAGFSREPRARASLATLGCASVAFLMFGTAMWAQLTIGWQWSRPATTATAAAMVVMSVAMLLLLSFAALASIPLAFCVLRDIAHRRAKGLLGPSLLFLASGVALVIGARHFGNGWPGTGGHPWAHRGLVPGGVAAFAWASTLSVSSYWAHPAALASFPTAEIGWMVLSPLAFAGVMVGAVKSVRRVELPPVVVRYETWLARAAAVGMLVFLAGCSGWIVDGGPGPRNLFHTGAIDVVGLVVMAGALAVIHQAAHRARLATSLAAAQ